MIKSTQLCKSKPKKSRMFLEYPLLYVFLGVREQAMHLSVGGCISSSHFFEFENYYDYVPILNNKMIFRNSIYNES